MIPDIDAYNTYEGETRGQEVQKTYDFTKEKKMFQARMASQQKKAEAADRKNEEAGMRSKRGRPRGRPKSSR